VSTKNCHGLNKHMSAVVEASKKPEEVNEETKKPKEEEVKYCFFLKDEPILTNLAVYKGPINYTGITALSRHMHDITETKITVLFDDLGLQLLNSDKKFLFKSFHLNATMKADSEKKPETTEPKTDSENKPETTEPKTDSENKPETTEPTPKTEPKTDSENKPETTEPTPKTEPKTEPANEPKNEPKNEPANEPKNLVVLEKVTYDYYKGTPNVFTNCEEWVEGRSEVPFFYINPDEILYNYKDLIYFRSIHSVYESIAESMRPEDAITTIEAVKKNESDILKDDSKRKSELRGKTHPNYNKAIINDSAYKMKLAGFRNKFKEWNRRELKRLYNNTDPITVIATMIFSAYHDVIGSAKLKMMVHGTLQYQPESRNTEIAVGEVPEATSLSVMFPGFLTKYYSWDNFFDNCEYSFVDDGRITYTSGQSFADVYVDFAKGNIAIKLCVPNVYQEKETNQWDLWSSILLYKLLFYGEIEEECTYDIVTRMARDRLFWIGHIDVSIYSCSISQCVQKACFLEKEDMRKLCRNNEVIPLLRKYAAYVLMLNYNIEFNKRVDFFSTPGQTIDIIKKTYDKSGDSVVDFLKSLDVPVAFEIRENDDFFTVDNLKCIYGSNLKIPKTLPAILSLMKLYWLHRGYGISCRDVVEAMEPERNPQGERKKTIEDIKPILLAVSRERAIEKINGNTTQTTPEQNKPIIQEQQTTPEEMDKIYREIIASLNINFDVLFAYPKEKYGTHTQIVLDVYRIFNLKIIAADVNHLFNHLYVSTPKNNNPVVDGIRNFIFDKIRLKTNTTFMSKVCAKILAARKLKLLDNLRGNYLINEVNAKVDLSEISIYYYIFWYAYWDSVNIKPTTTKKQSKPNIETWPEQLQNEYLIFSGKTKEITIAVDKEKINVNSNYLQKTGKKDGENKQKISGDKIVTIDHWETSYSFSRHTIVTTSNDDIRFTVKWKYDPQQPKYYPIFTGPNRVYAEQMAIDFDIKNHPAKVEFVDNELQLTLLPKKKEGGGHRGGMSNFAASVVGGAVIVLCALLPR